MIALITKTRHIWMLPLSFSSLSAGAVGDGEGMGDGAGINDGEGVGELEGVGLAVGKGVGLGVGEGVGLGVGDGGVEEGVGLSVGEGVGVGVGTGLTMSTTSSDSIDPTVKLRVSALAGAMTFIADTIASCICVGVTAFNVWMRLCPAVAA